MSDDDFQSLKDSIEVNGVLNPVTIFDGQVIDGWHRYTAANELAMDCPTVELGDVDPRDFVLAQNKARRHVTQAQLALATTAVYAWKPVGANQHEGRVDTECPPSKTNAELSKISGVHANTIKQAKAVQTKAAPEVVEAVKRGEIGLPKAAAISKLPKDQQVAAISKPISKQEKPRTVEPLHLVTPTGEVITDADMGNDPLELLKETQQDLDAAHKQIEILTKDNTKSELHKMILQRDHAVRQQSEAMDKAFESQKREKRTKALLMRCGKAVGEDDPEKIPATVEAMARATRKAA